MRDSRGRNIDYMRISITDKCNLRCRYCMPYGIEHMPRWEILSLEEIQAVVISAASLGIHHIKITGGEPLVRRDCIRLVELLKSVPGIETVTITTNGILLEEKIEELVRAGIDGINISLDTMNRDLYWQLTGFDGLEKVLRVLEKLTAYSVPVKINAVSMDLEAFAKSCGITVPMTGEMKLPLWQQVAEIAKDLPVDVRFIEMMPIGYGKQFKTVDHREFLEELFCTYPGLCRDNSRHGFGPAVYYHAPGFKGSIGLISAIHGKFCDTCNRVRITAQGCLKTCLCYGEGIDLRNILRNGEERPATEGHYHWPQDLKTDDEILQMKLRAAMEEAIKDKPAAHCFERLDEITEKREMVSIGG